MSNLKLTKIIFSTLLFIFVMQIANVKIHFQFYTIKSILILFLSLCISILIISLRTHIIYNKEGSISFYNLTLFNFLSWCLNNIIIAGTSELLKIFFFRKVGKINLLCYIFIEKLIPVINLFFLISIYIFLLYYLNSLSYRLFNILLIFSLLIFFCYFIFKNNFFIQRVPYFNLINFNLNIIIKSFLMKDFFLLFLANISLHAVSFFNLYLILTTLNIEFNLYILLTIYFVYYLSGVLQIFPGGLGIRELLFFILSQVSYINGDDLINLSIFITSLNIIFSFLIYFIINFVLGSAKISNLFLAPQPKIVARRKINKILS